MKIKNKKVKASKEHLTLKMHKKEEILGIVGTEQNINIERNVQ